MFGFLARLFRVLWRQETEGFRTGAVSAPDLPSSQAVFSPAAPVAFLRCSAETALPRQGRRLAGRLLSVQRLNPPVGRSRSKSELATVGKRQRPIAQAQIKASRAAKPGVVLDRIALCRRRGSADIVNLTEVRRARQIEAANRELTALFK